MKYQALRHGAPLFALALAALICHDTKPAGAQGQPAASTGADTLTFDAPQTAGISGFRAMWDTPIVLDENGATADVDEGRFGKAASAYWFPDAKARQGDGGTLKPGPLVFDAVHRSLLVRFPGAAEKIAAELNAGKTIAKLELVLPYKSTELWPEAYAQPAGLSFLGDQWVKTPPRWHAVAWALRKPWQADATNGPTYNAAINGAVYWKKYGAADETVDRFPTRFGPAEVSSQADDPLDVTALVDDPGFGKTVAERLRKLEYCGFLVRKEEIYDMSLFRGSYEWQTARGVQGILIDTPKLIVSFEIGKPAKIKPADVTFDLAAYTAAQKRAGTGGAPTAVVPSPDEFEKLKARLGFARPAWMPDWQWKRVSELHDFGGGVDFPQTYPAYLDWLDEQLARAPRSWRGFDAADVTQNYFKNYDALPEPVRDHWKLYWWAWLMPDRDYESFDYNGKNYSFAQGYIGGKEMQAYQDATHDWRGNTSVYRTYMRAMGTMNFNHWAIAGDLLGGSIIGSEKMVREGRAGLEQWPLRTWSWYDGSTQESIDHYYFSESLTSQKIFADFGPEPMDRMIGQSILGKSVEELASDYHPGLRRFIASSGRTGVAYVLGIQDGTMNLLDTLSPKGVLLDTNAPRAKPGADMTVTAPNVEGMPVFGHNLTPGMVARQTLNGPWAPDWFANIIDNKPLPYQFTATYKQWGAYNATPLWRRSYLGKNYGMASLDVTTSETVPFMVQWRRAPITATSMTDLGTLLLRGGANRTELLDSQKHGTTTNNPNGDVGQQGVQIMTMQDKNRAIVFSSPLPKLHGDGAGRDEVGDVKSIQTTIGLFNFEAKPSWQLYVDGHEVTLPTRMPNQQPNPLPIKVRYGQKITLRDGVSYIGIIPIAASDLGRDTEVEISDSGVMTEMQGGGKAREALRIDAYMYHSDAPIDKARPDLDLAYGGYAIEAGDVDEYGSFENFQKHIDAAQLKTTWNDATKTVDATYTTGSDTLHCLYKPAYAGGGLTTDGFPLREVNGVWPYLPPGIDRDSTLTQQGTTGSLDKNGARVLSEPGHMAYLQTEPLSGTYAGFNPFSDPTYWEMDAPGGVRVRADGRIGMARVTVVPKANTVSVAYGVKGGDETRADLATCLLVSGTTAAPTADVNGAAVKATPVTIDGTTAYLIPLGKANPTGADAAMRMDKAQAAFDGLRKPATLAN